MQRSINFGPVSRLVRTQPSKIWLAIVWSGVIYQNQYGNERSQCRCQSNNKAKCRTVRTDSPPSHRNLHFNKLIFSAAAAAAAVAVLSHCKTVAHEFWQPLLSVGFLTGDIIMTNQKQKTWTQNLERNTELHSLPKRDMLIEFIYIFLNFWLCLGVGGRSPQVSKHFWQPNWFDMKIYRN